MPSPYTSRVLEMGTADDGTVWMSVHQGEPGRLEGRDLDDVISWLALARTERDGSALMAPQRTSEVTPTPTES